MEFSLAKDSPGPLSGSDQLLSVSAGPAAGAATAPEVHQVVVLRRDGADTGTGT
ncbi:hypothetical protein ACLH0K_16405 [Arthrobacter sp. MPF02]|uniref:hypothetical protein n=1 Tax=Arthrobacter sp. MPF02 TaxID=3388492 RepID=UPI003984C661